MRIAVIGSGIAGLTCAHVLGRDHEVVLYEADERLGGHANTVDVEDPTAGTLAVDTGFIVHNDRNYPHLTRLFDQLNVPVQDTEMSFGVIDRDPASSTAGFAYRASNLNTLFADRSNLLKPTMWKMLFDIGRFYRNARRFLADPDPSLSLADFLAEGGYSREFTDLHLLPMGAAVWSADPLTFDQFPAASLLRFLSNHGLLGVGDRPQWRTIVGGSRVYVTELARQFEGNGGEVRLGMPVRSIRRSSEGPTTVEVVTSGGREHYDHVIVAAHSDQALAMVADASVAEKEVLGAIRYQPNRATLHTDESLLPPHRKAWAAWNYERRGAAPGAATLTYDMTDLQHLPGERRYLVSLNSDDAIDPDAVLASFNYAHPVFDAEAIAAQARFDEVNGSTLEQSSGISFCGAYWGYGFHEDGIASAVRVCAMLGSSL